MRRCGYRLCCRQSIAPFALENNAEAAAVGQIHAFAQMPLPPQTVERARDGAGVGPTLGGFTLEPVDLLDDFDGKEDIVILKVENRIGVVKKNVGIEDIIFHA